MPASRPMKRSSKRRALRMSTPARPPCSPRTTAGAWLPLSACAAMTDSTISRRRGTIAIAANSIASSPNRSRSPSTKSRRASARRTSIRRRTTCTLRALGAAPFHARPNCSRRSAPRPDFRGASVFHSDGAGATSSCPVSRTARRTTRFRGGRAAVNALGSAGEAGESSFAVHPRKTIALSEVRA